MTGDRHLFRGLCCTSTYILTYSALQQFTTPTGRNNGHLFSNKTLQFSIPLASIIHLLQTWDALQSPISSKYENIITNTLTKIKIFLCQCWSAFCFATQETWIATANFVSKEAKMADTCRHSSSSYL